VVQIFMMAKRGSQFSQLLFDRFHITPSMIKNPRQAGVEKELRNAGRQALASFTSRIRS
jgi:hypothetical protein